MKKLITNKYYILLWAVVVGALNAIIFLTIKSKNRQAAFWVTYGFLMGAFVLNLVSALLFKANSENIYAPTTFTFYFIGISLVVFIIFLIFPTASFLWPLIPLIIFLAMFLILYIFGAMNQEWIKKNPQKRPEIFNMTQLVTYLTELQTICKDVAVRNNLNELTNVAMNALPNQDNKPAVEAKEKQIFEYAGFLRKNVERDQITNVFNNIERIKKLLKERETLIK